MGRRKESPDFATPLTNKVLRDLLSGNGVPVGCDSWDKLVKHAKEMERRAYAYRAVATAIASPIDRGI